MNKKAVAVEKQIRVIVEAMDSHKSVGQVRFWAVDVYDRQVILDGIVYDEKLELWKDVADKMEYSQDWENAFIEYGAKNLLKHNYTCKYAMFGKNINRENLVIAVDSEKIKTLLECYGYRVNRLTDLDKKRGN